MGRVRARRSRLLPPRLASASYGCGWVAGSGDSRRLAAGGSRPSRSPPLAVVTSRRELNRDVSILGEKF